MPTTTAEASKPTHTPRRITTLMRGYLLAAGLGASATALCFVLSARIAEAPALLFVVAVLCSAWYGGLGPALLCTAIGAFAIDFWFIDPPWEVDLTPGTLLRVAVFALVGISVSSLTVRRRRAAEALARTNDELERRVRERTDELVAARLAQDAALRTERDRFAREIHDHLAQGLTGVLVQLGAARLALTDDSLAQREAEVHIETARKLARESLEEARRSVWALRPQALEDATLAEALARVLHDTTAGTHVHAELSVLGAPHPLASTLEEDLLRIGQEALGNALRHGESKSVRMELVFGEHEMVFSIADDGHGMPDGAFAPSDGRGLRNMQDRAERNGGVLRVYPGSNGGTTVAITLPIGDRES